MLNIVPMRKQDEIQRAHDLLVGVILGETNHTEEERLLLGPLAGVLCWCLNHEHNQDFATLLTDLEAEAKAQGFSFKKE